MRVTAATVLTNLRSLLTQHVSQQLFVSCFGKANSHFLT